MNEHCLVFAHIISTLTGMAYPHYLKKHIFEPLGMTSATQNSHTARESGKAVDGFVRVVEDDGIGEAKPMGWWTETDSMWASGPGGLAMSIEDNVSNFVNID